MATVVAIIGLRPVGRMLKDRASWWYRGALALIVLVAVAVIGIAMDVARPGMPLYDVLWGVGLGLGFGGLAGLRYGHDGLFAAPPAVSARDKGADHS
jgi:cytosine/uracil/thiamine/allantoin permease